MAASTRYDPLKKVVYVEVQGPAALEDIEALVEGIVRSPDYPPNVNVLWDLRGAAFETLETVLVHQLAGLRRRYPERGPSRCAIVVASDLGFGLMRMHNALVDDLPVDSRVFRDMTGAERWVTSAPGELIGGPAQAGFAAGRPGQPRSADRA